MKRLFGCILVAATFLLGQPCLAQPTAPNPATSPGSGYNPTAPTVSYPGRGFNLQQALRQQQRQVPVQAYGAYGAGATPASNLPVSLPADANAILPMGYGGYGYGYGGYGSGSLSFGGPQVYGAAGNGGFFPYASGFPIPPNATPSAPYPGQVPLSGVSIFGPPAGAFSSGAVMAVPATSVAPSGGAAPPTSSGAGTLGTSPAIRGVISTGVPEYVYPIAPPNMMPIFITPTVPGR